MSWFRHCESNEDPEQITSRVVVCAPPEDLPFWKARLESLGVNRVDLHHIHRDALNKIRACEDPRRQFSLDGAPVDWKIIMLFDKKIERAPDFSEKDKKMLSRTDYYTWTSATEIGDWSPKNVTYKSSDQKLVDLLADAFDRSMDWVEFPDHVYKPKRRAVKGKL